MQEIFITPSALAFWRSHKGWLPVCQYPPKFHVEEGEQGMIVKRERDGVIREIEAKVIIP